MQVLDLRRLPDVKRDMNLLRELLLKIEANPEMDGTREFYYSTPEDIGISGYSVEEVAYHLRLLIQEGFIDGAVTMAFPMQIIRCLSNDGHDFLDNIRTDNIWSKVKARLDDLTGSVSIAVIAAIAEAEVKKYFKLT